MGQSASGTLLISSQYLIPIFLVMIFGAALFSSRTKIPYIIVLVIFGIGLSVLSFLGPDLLNVNEFRIDPRLIINFVIPPLIFEAMMKVNYKEFRAVRISALLLATVGVIVSTFGSWSSFAVCCRIEFRSCVSFCCVDFSHRSSNSD